MRDYFRKISKILKFMINLRKLTYALSTLNEKNKYTHN